MDWENESYVRIYTRDTTTWRLLGWDGQCVLMQVFRKLDMSGVLDIDNLEPWEAVALHCGLPEQVARDGVAKCLKREVLVHRGSALIAPNFYEAQTVSKSDKARQAESRERNRLRKLGRIPVTDSDETVTNRDDQSRGVTKESRAVTGSHDESHAVTLCSAVPCSTVLGSALPSSAVVGEGVADAPPPAAAVELRLAVQPEMPATLVLPKRKAKPPKDPLGSQITTAATWDAYSAAYLSRYGDTPVSNARVRGQVKLLVQRVPADEAPGIAAHYVGSQHARYVAAGHPIGMLLQDAEKLRTEWATGKRVTQHEARSADKQTGRGNEYREGFKDLAHIQIGRPQT